MEIGKKLWTFKKIMKDYQKLWVLYIHDAFIMFANFIHS